MVNLVSCKEFLKHGTAIKVGNITYSLVVLWVYDLDLTLS